MAQPTQLNPTEQDALVKQIGLALLRAAPADWHSISVEYRALGRYAEATGKLTRADESAEEFKVSPEIAVLFTRLRAGMYREGRGTWYNARYQLDQPSAYNLEYDRDEPQWINPPPPPAYADDLRMFPREEQNVPEWLMRRMAGLKPPFRVARIFDGAGPNGKPMVNRPPIDDAEEVLRYLDSAPLALPQRGFDKDYLDDEGRQAVPVAFHTDGTWIWPAAVNYYLRAHATPPEPDLLDHIRRAAGPPDVDEPTRTAAANFMTRGAPRRPNGSPQPDRQAGRPEPGRPAADARPAEPGRPAEAGRAGEPGRPAEPGRAGEPNQPGLPIGDVRPADASRPGEPSHAEAGRPSGDNRPTEANRPGEPGHGADLGRVGEPAELGRPIDSRPAEAGRPGEPGRGANLGHAGEPTQPGRPGHEAEPGRTAEPRHPGDPGRAADLSRTAEPRHPGDPGRAADLSRTGEPNQPGESGRGADLGRTGDPAQSTEPNRPTGSGLPGEPVRGTESGYPGEPRRGAEPGHTGEPGHPGEPGRGADLGRTGDPAQPTEPNRPTGFGLPGEPVRGAEPGYPGEPRHGGEASRGAEPGRGEPIPAEAGRPVRDGRPAEPGHPAESGLGSQPSEPVRGAEPGHRVAEPGHADAPSQGESGAGRPAGAPVGYSRPSEGVADLFTPVRPVDAPRQNGSARGAEADPRTEQPNAPRAGVEQPGPRGDVQPRVPEYPASGTSTRPPIMGPDGPVPPIPVQAGYAMLHRDRQTPPPVDETPADTAERTAHWTPEWAAKPDPEPADGPQATAKWSPTDWSTEIPPEHAGTQPTVDETAAHLNEPPTDTDDQARSDDTPAELDDVQPTAVDSQDLGADIPTPVDTEAPSREWAAATQPPATPSGDWTATPAAVEPGEAQPVANPVADEQAQAPAHAMPHDTGAPAGDDQESDGPAHAHAMPVDGQAPDGQAHTHATPVDSQAPDGQAQAHAIPHDPRPVVGMPDSQEQAHIPAPAGAQSTLDSEESDEEAHSYTQELDDLRAADTPPANSPDSQEQGEQAEAPAHAMPVESGPETAQAHQQSGDEPASFGENAEGWERSEESVIPAGDLSPTELGDRPTGEWSGEPATIPAGDVSPTEVADAVVPVTVELSAADEEAVARLRERLAGLGIAEGRYRVGEGSDVPAWAMVRAPEGWQVGWYDDGFRSSALFVDAADAGAFLVGKLLLDEVPAEGPATVRAPLADLEDDDDDEYDRRSRKPVAPSNGGDELFRPTRTEPAGELFQPTVAAPSPVFDDEEEDEYQLARTAPRPAQRKVEPKRPQDWPIQPRPGEPPLTLFRGKALTELAPGTEIDRYGEPGGNLTYAAGTPFERRSLVPDWVTRPYRAYRVARPTEVLTGIAIPWFEQPGGGTAFILARSVAELVDSGNLVEITDREPPTRAH
ncbi:glycohydrolase toxin TNT-related protein [Actinokineospora sp. HUAS TT18]|uniref:glycohydrolase toxin TNT-related protein n=1 Tax=Actinokineospora sp. HUAS TT18 TaxID=3447451 RepID=UPI003F51C083